MIDNRRKGKIRKLENQLRKVQHLNYMSFGMRRKCNKNVGGVLSAQNKE